MPLIGSDVKNPNFVLRFCLIVFAGLICVGVTLSWRSGLLSTEEYQDLPVSHQAMKIRNENMIKKEILMENTGQPEPTSVPQTIE